MRGGGRARYVSRGGANDPLSRSVGCRDGSVVRFGPRAGRPARGTGHVGRADRPQRRPVGRRGGRDPPRAVPGCRSRPSTADLSTPSGLAALLGRVGDRPIEVLVNNAGFGSYGPFVEADADREADEVAVDVSAVVALARAFLPGMIARAAAGSSTSPPPLRSSPRLTRPCTARAKPSSCRSARRCGPRPARPA